MQPAFSNQFSEPLPAAMPRLSEKPRLGVPSKNPASHPEPNVPNSTVAIGLQFRCSEVVSGQVVAPNNACSSALKAANRSAAGVARANAAWSVLQTAANANGIPPALLAAIAVRESNFMNVQETLAGGGPGPGMGVFQLTNQRGVSSAQAFNIPFAANYSAGMLSSNMSYLSGAFSFTPAQLLQATAASYNFGTGNISGNPNTIDVGTTGGNYGSTVVGMIACFSHP